ncbi:MAG: hypothetical protein MUC29_12780 [Pyrinomonadaceae bacterium]|jgi:hypothetical protein|nr:hypothetical protein [Pyrinomonadaceae bacterium]
MTESLKVLLTEIVDYAGLFPPSKVGMTSAVHNYENYRRSENAWLLGRFIVPISRLDEFLFEAESKFDENIWRLSVIAEGNLEENVNKIAKFNEVNAGKAIVDTLEVKVNSADEIHEANKILPNDLTVFFEIPLQDIMTDLMIALAMTKKRAKIRTGGITQSAFPNSAEIIKFMRVCIAANVPFKATAGLHHPLKCVKPLTYEENAPIGTMHGFFNVFLAACFLRQNLNNSFVHELINDTDISNFKFYENSISWKNQTISVNEISLTRTKNAISFGSCSFLEPIEDLTNLELM